MLSIAFAPDYATTRRFYVYYVDQAENARVVEFRRSAANPNVADPRTARNVLVVRQPSGEHYGGLLLFGPDGYLYLGIGDGGLVRRREPQRAQWGDHLHGKLLRIDPRPSAGRPYGIPRSNPFVRRAGWRGEIWALGLRNPWRYWIDPVTRDLYVGDAGEYVIESVDYAPRRRSTSTPEPTETARSSGASSSAIPGFRPMRVTTSSRTSAAATSAGSARRESRPSTRSASARQG